MSRHTSLEIDEAPWPKYLRPILGLPTFCPNFLRFGEVSCLPPQSLRQHLEQLEQPELEKELLELQFLDPDFVYFYDGRM